MTEPVQGAVTFQVAADDYDRLVGRYSPALARELIGRSGVAAGQRALDVGCGPGALTRQLADLLGAANVSAIDPSEPFAAACRERVPGVRVEVGPAEDLPFEDASFDVSLAQLVVNFMTDAVAGVRQLRRVTVGGGTVGAAVWDYRGEMTLLRTFWDAALALDPAAPDEGRTMRYATPDELATLWSVGGISDVQVEPVLVSADYLGFDDLWAPLLHGVAPSGAYVASLTPTAREALREEFAGRLEVTERPFTLTARAWVVTGLVPEP
jgi:ubiquinone/menaquinone biosynthesis C-methylase UbiE